MDISIIIVSWNAKEFLSECLQSLTAETDNHCSEIIVVDNASTDGSLELVQKHFPHVKLIRSNTNVGFAKANNIGIRQSIGRYVAFINSDVKVLEGCLNRILAYMDKHPDIGMLGPKILNPDSTVQRSFMRFPTLWNNLCRALALDTLFPKSKLFGDLFTTFGSYDTIRTVEVIFGCFWMVRREALNQVGLLDENFFIYGEDIDWCKRFWDSDWKVVFFPYAEAIHYGGASSSNVPIRFHLERQQAILQYWEKYYSRPILICLLLILWFYQIVRIVGHTVLYIIKPSKRIQAAFTIKKSTACIRCILKLRNKNV